MEDNLSIRRDRMRFTKNTASSRLALLAIVLNVLFFISIYRSVPQFLNSFFFPI